MWPQAARLARLPGMCAPEDGDEGRSQAGCCFLATLLAADLGQLVGVLSAKVVQRVSLDFGGVIIVAYNFIFIYMYLYCVHQTNKF